MVITTFIDLTRTTMVYRLAYMKKSGNRLFRYPDFVNHYNNPFSQTCQQPAFMFFYLREFIRLPVGTTLSYRNQVGPRFYVSTSKSIIKALINMHSFEIQLSPIG